MDSIRLVRPAPEYKESYIAAVTEFHAEGREEDLDPEALEQDFETYLETLRKKITEPEEKKVPETVLWLVDGKEYIGTVSIRHELNEKLQTIGGHIGYHIRPSKRGLGYGTRQLALALPEAKKLGINTVLITCDSTNIGSRKIIEHNGGVLENEVPGEPGKPSKLRFWIALD